jgi:hypothetical protein
MSTPDQPALLRVLLSALLAVAVYGAVGLALAALTALGTSGLKLTLVATVAGFGAAITLGGARHLPLLHVLGAGVVIIAALHGLARAGDLLLPFTTFHPISGAVAAGVCVALIYAMRRTGAGSIDATGQTDA